MDGQSPLERLPSLAAGERIGDAERERAATALSEHFAAGRLDRAEFDVRLDAAYAARTGAELEPLFVDLPAPTPLVGSRTTAREPQARRRRAGRALVVPLLPLLLIIAVVVTVSHGEFPFFVFPLLWFIGAFRHRRGW